MKKTSVQRRSLLKAGAGTATLWPLPSIWAQEAKLRPLEDFFRAPQLSNVAISPDGRTLLALRQSNGRTNLAVVDLGTMKTTIVTNFSDADVSEPRWISGERMVFSLRDQRQGGGYQRAGGLMAINKDGTAYVQLAQRDWLADGDSRARLPANTTVYGKGQTSSPDEIIVIVHSSGASRRYTQRLERLNTRTGRTTPITLGAPGDPSQWLLDSKDVPRAVVTREERVFQLWVRAGEAAEWRSLQRWDILEPAIEPAALMADGNLLVLANAHGSDTRGVFLLDTQSGVIDPEPVVSLKGYDIDAVAYHSKSDEVLGVRYEAARPGIAWFSAEHEALQKGFEQVFPDRTVRFSSNLKSEAQKLLVTTTSDTDAGTYYLYDQKAKGLTKIGETRPWLPAAEMASTQFIRYTARDGLSIPAQLTLPKGVKPENLPLIVLHYGGPMVRAIHWGFDPWCSCSPRGAMRC